MALRDDEVSGRDGGGIHLELVVLTRDVKKARLQILDRMVGAVMPKGQSRCGGAGGSAEDLVPEADAKQRNPAEGLARQLDRPGQDGRVTRAV